MVFTFCFDAYLSFTRARPMVRLALESECPMANAHGIDRAEERPRMRAVSGAFSIVSSMKVYSLEQRCSCERFPGDYHNLHERMET